MGKVPPVMAGVKKLLDPAWALTVIDDTFMPQTRIGTFVENPATTGWPYNVGVRVAWVTFTDCAPKLES